MEQYFEKTDKKIEKLFENILSLAKIENEPCFSDILLDKFIEKYKREFANESRRCLAINTWKLHRI